MDSNRTGNIALLAHGLAIFCFPNELSDPIGLYVIYSTECDNKEETAG